MNPFLIRAALLILYSLKNYKQGFFLFLAFRLFLNNNINLINLPGVPLDDPWTFYIAQFHNLGFVLCIFLFLGHMAAFMIKANRSLLPAMFSGKVDRSYALERHSLWSAE